VLLKILREFLRSSGARPATDSLIRNYYLAIRSSRSLSQVIFHVEC
jgi:hypothetical protein